MKDYNKLMYQAAQQNNLKSLKELKRKQELEEIKNQEALRKERS